jgi:hypothetical protein
MKCFQSVNIMSGTADFGESKTNLKLKVGGFDQLEDDPIDEYDIESDKEKEGQLQASDGELSTGSSSENIAEDWWNQQEDSSD